MSLAALLCGVAWNYQLSIVNELEEVAIVLSVPTFFLIGYSGAAVLTREAPSVNTTRVSPGVRGGIATVLPVLLVAWQSKHPWVN